MKSNVGCGSAMIAVFPSETCPEASVIDQSVVSSPAFRQEIMGKRCLIVDDIPENTFLLQELLQTHGLQAESRNRAKDALEYYKSFPKRIDLIITDLRMPEMSGQVMIMEIRKFEKTSKRPPVPIVVLTGESAAAEKIACLSQYEADDYLLKPIKLQDFMRAVDNCLSKSRLRKAKNVLLVDDDTMSRKLIASLLRHSGEQCTECKCISEV